MKNNPQRNRARAKEWYAANPERAKAQRGAYYQKNKHKWAAVRDKKRAEDPIAWGLARRHYAMKWKYGLAAQDYQRIYDSQEGKCAICRAFRPWPTLHIDHDHTTNQVRGLLCATCNQALGLLKERADLMLRAADYICGRVVYG